MVDQLWLWIIDESKHRALNRRYSANYRTFLETVITCFPQIFAPESENRQPADSRPKNKKLQDKELIDKIRTHIHDKARPKISSAYHLATIITSFCVAEVEDCSVDISGSESPLRMFASAIGTVVSFTNYVTDYSDANCAEGGCAGQML